MKENQVFDIFDLTLWDQNPRNDREFVLSEEVKSEEEIITEILSRQRVKSSLPGLLDDLFSRGSIQESFIVYQKINDQGEVTYQTFDGNRRLLLLKIINYPNLLIESKLDEEKIKHICKTIKSVNVIYYSSDERNEALNHVKTRHYGLDDGRGQLDWDSDNKANIDALLGETNFSIGNKIIDFYKAHAQDPKFESVYEKIAIKPDKTTLDRIFESKAISKNVFNLKSKNEYNLDSPVQQEKVNEVLEHFYENTSGKVTEVYTKAQIESQFQNIKPIELDQLYGGEDLFSTPSKSQRKNNRYTTNFKLFNWRKRAFDFQDSNLKKVLNLTISKYEVKNLERLYEFDKMVAFILFRTICELAIKEFMRFFNENKNAFNLNHPDALKYVDAMNSGEDSPVFTAKKISALINLSDLLKDQTRRVKVEDHIKLLRKKNFAKEDSRKLISFIENIHSTVHGNSKSTENYLQEYDTYILTLLEIINKVCK